MLKAVLLHWLGAFKCLKQYYCMHRLEASEMMESCDSLTDTQTDTAFYS